MQCVIDVYSVRSDPAVYRTDNAWLLRRRHFYHCWILDQLRSDIHRAHCRNLFTPPLDRVN